jgi:threonyl-tRNA synthetase
VDYAKKIIKKIGEEISDIRLDADFRQTTVPAKVKDAEIMRIPYIIVAGDREEKEKTLAVREKGSSKIKTVKTEEFIKMIKKEISERI